MQFRSVAYKDLGAPHAAGRAGLPAVSARSSSATSTTPSGPAPDDFNHDGVTDIVAGPHIYFGPDYTTSREIYLATTVNPSTSFAS